MSSSNWFGLGHKSSSLVDKSDKQKFHPFSFGLKSKKPTALALNSPLPRSPVASPTTSPLPYSTSSYTTRPPSKSVSSRDDSIGPRTPSDTHRASIVTHNSLMTLSDTDPFASRGISFQHSSPDPNRLSKYSNVSSPEYASKPPDSGDSRFSYASSSSHGAVNEPSPIAFQSKSDQHYKSTSPSRSSSVRLRHRPSNFSSEGSLDDAWESLARANNGVHAGVVEGQKSGQPSSLLPERPRTRSRGLTESSASRPNFVPGEVYMRAPPEKPSLHSAPVSPRVVVRQASQPQLAPPDVPLPPPPVLDKPFGDADSAIFHGPNHSAASSNFSFNSSRSSHGRRIDSQDWSPRSKESLPEDTIMFASFKGDSDPDLPASIYRTPSNSPAPATLKKAISQQSLRRQVSNTPTTPAPSSATSTPPLTPSSERSVRKQRSFHHPKFPIPPIPTALRSATTTPSPLPSQDFSPSESKRGSAISSSSRKRLFSGTALRRPSTASCTPSVTIEDDARSIFSVQSEGEHRRGTAHSVQSLLPDDFGPAERTAPKASAQDYTPQNILSPADMYIIEASMESSSSRPPSRPGLRPRGLSSSTTQTENDDGMFGAALSPSSASIRSHRSGPAPSRTPSVQSSNSLALPRHISRPSHSLEDLGERYVGERYTDRVPSPPPPMTSLPPPPRPRRSTTSSFSSTKSPASTAWSDRSPGLPPPPRRPPPSSMEKSLHRRSIMRKPSFLEIDDTDGEDDNDTDDGLDTTIHAIQHKHGQVVSSSFLDLARESFDTAR